MVDFINDEWVPLAVALDISCSEFYSLTPKILNRRIPYYAEMARRKKQEKDEDAWLSNAYTKMAISTIGKGRYPEKPLDIYGVRKIIEDENDEAEVPTDADLFSAWAMAFNKEKFGTIGESEVKDDG